MAQLTKAILNTVVAMSRDWGPGREWRTCGTGFIYGRPLKTESGRTEYDLYLVTNAHLFEEPESKYLYDQIWIAVNGPGDNAISKSRLQLKNRQGNPLWTSKKLVDVAVYRVKFKDIPDTEGEFEVLDSEKHCVTLIEMRKLGVRDGEAVMSIGYPLDLCKTLDKFPIVRGGTLCDITQAIKTRSDSFLCDLMAFPGASGSPVFLRPTPYHHESEPELRSLRCIGLLSGHFVSRADDQTYVKKLSRVWTIDVVEELIQKHLRQHGLTSDYSRKLVM